jgi:hypothetical protein
MYVPRNRDNLIRDGWTEVVDASRYVRVYMCSCGWHTGLITGWYETVHVCPLCGEGRNCFKETAIWRERWTRKLHWWSETRGEIVYGYAKPVVECKED